MKCPKCGKKMKSKAYTHVYSDGSAERVQYYECSYCGERVNGVRHRVDITRMMQC
jgi:DNA-directed RNA polymerase subunit RPC12/RpoP